MVALSWFGLLMLVYLYGGYVKLLQGLAMIMKCDTKEDSKEVELSDAWPAVTVLITAYNEGEKITKRIENVLSCWYPYSLLEVLVASDGSTDTTDEQVTAIGDERVRLFRPNHRVGKTDTQNKAVAEARGEIIVFTDADTVFAPDFLVAIVRPFRDLQVGGVDGNLLFVTEPGAISRSQGFYWAQELKIRTLESCLGWLAVGSGACLAIRKSLFRPMVATVGEDCLIPLDVVRQGHQMVHACEAIAYDCMPSDPRCEFRTRVRMTLRNWQGTWMYPDLLNPLRHPGIAFALWSHKVLRWLSPVFLLLWLGTGLVVLPYGIEIAALPSWFALVFIIAAVLGGVSQMIHYPIPKVGMIYSFCLANAGLLVGVLLALSGSRITTYR